MSPKNPSYGVGLSDARQFLRQEQRTGADVVLRQVDAPSTGTTEQTLKALEQRYQALPDSDDANLVRRGRFRFQKAVESSRLSRARSLIRRTEPGPLEDPTRLARLAYQAASLELALSTYGPLPKANNVDAAMSKFILGTVDSPEVNARAKELLGYTVVLVNSAITDFISEAGRAVVEALRPVVTTDGSSAANAIYDLDRVKMGLAENPAPAYRLFRFFESYFFSGHTNQPAEEALEDAEQIVLDTFVPFAERWILAHEYGHGLANSQDFGAAPNNKSWAKEFNADSSATVLTVMSAESLDGMPPEFALAGANFSLACLLLRDRAHSLLKQGHEGTDEGSVWHPAYEDRAHDNVQTFRRFFDVVYQGNQFQLTFVLRRDPPTTHTFGKEHNKRAFAYADVLLTIWPTVRAMLLKEHASGRPLHPRWL